MRYLAIAAFLGALSIPLTASAAVTVSIDMDTSLEGIQPERFARNGEVFDVDIVLTVTGSSTLTAYGFGVLLDDTELSFISFSPKFPQGFGAAGDPPELTSGDDDRNSELGDVPYLQFSRISALSGGTLGAGQYEMGTLRLRVDNSSTDSFRDIMPGIFPPGSGGLFGDENFDDISAQVIFNGGTVTAVPEPGTWAVLGLASVGVGVRHWRRKISGVKA